jgi:hypothetical protein
MAAKPSRGGGSSPLASLLATPTPAATVPVASRLALLSYLLFFFFVFAPLLRVQAQATTSFDLNDPASYGPALDAVTAFAASAGGSSPGGVVDCTGRLQWTSSDFATSAVLLPCGRVIEAHTNELEDSSYGGSSSSSDDPFGVNAACTACLGSVGTIIVPRMLEAGLNPTDPTLAGRAGAGGGSHRVYGMMK